MGKPRTKGAHKLVAYAFLAPPEPGQDLVRHLNGLAWWNHPSNLGWGANLDNGADAVRHGTAPTAVRNGRAKLTGEKVAEIKASSEPAKRLAERFGVSFSQVYRIKQGEEHDRGL